MSSISERKLIYTFKKVLKIHFKNFSDLSCLSGSSSSPFLQNVFPYFKQSQMPRSVASLYWNKIELVCLLWNSPSTNKNSSWLWAAWVRRSSAKFGLRSQCVGSVPQWLVTENESLNLYFGPLISSLTKCGQWYRMLMSQRLTVSFPWENGWKRI